MAATQPITARTALHDVMEAVLSSPHTREAVKMWVPTTSANKGIQGTWMHRFHCGVMRIYRVVPAGRLMALAQSILRAQSTKAVENAIAAHAAELQTKPINEVRVLSKRQMSTPDRINDCCCVFAAVTGIYGTPHKHHNS